MQEVEIDYVGIEENKEYENLIKSVIETCMKEEKLTNLNYYVCITLTNPSEIRKINNTYRKIDKETDVLSFPMFEKNEIANLDNTNEDILGDMVISIERVEEQAKEYGHSFERELAYMVVHSFYHLLGYDHMTEEDKKEMREKEENVLGILEIRRV